LDRNTTRGLAPTIERAVLVLSFFLRHFYTVFDKPLKTFIMNTTFKNEICEEINGLLILLSRSDANRALIVESLHMMDPVFLKEYRDSLVADLNITKPLPRNIEDEI
jgi:hypothetical protein